MDLDWSERSPHIRTLYHPWQQGNGYDEAILARVEKQLGFRLPTLLRTFYRAWGLRRDMTQMQDHLLNPAELIVRADAVIFCVENQAVCSWAIPREALNEPNPPVMIANLEGEEWRDHSPLTWRLSHARLSDFLDDFTYMHAHCPGGAIHGGFTEVIRHQKYQIAWLEQHWQRITVGPRCFGLTEELVNDYDYDFPFYVRDGQALAWCYGCCVAARSTEALDEIGQALQITWRKRW